MYDVEILLLIHYSDRYSKRLEMFKRFGLHQLGSNRIHITLAASPGDSERAAEILSGWPVSIHVSLLEFASREPLPKVTEYYFWLLESQLKARWFLRIDDDSWTDLSAMVRYADTRYGDVPVHIMTPPVQHDRHMVEVITELDLRIPSLHEHESSLTSARALRLLARNDKALHFLNYVTERYTYPGDLPLAWAMHICDVPTAIFEGSTKHFERTQMSLIGGRFFHIHFVSWEDGNFTTMLGDFLNGSIEPLLTDDAKALSGRTISFGRCVGQLLNTFRFDPDGTTSGDHNANEAYWSLLDNSLVLTSADKSKKTIFSRVLRNAGREWILGQFTAETTMHFIRVED